MHDDVVDPKARYLEPAHKGCGVSSASRDRETGAGGVRRAELTMRLGLSAHGKSCMSGEASCPVLWNGQETCHDEQGREIACANSGQDAESRRGQGWPRPRFELRGDTAQDRLTGLVWSCDASPAVYPLSWREALDFVGELNRRAAFGFF